MAEIFVSIDHTQYSWEREEEKVVKLSEEEIRLLRFKISLMSDAEILNRESGNGTAMGIPVPLSKDRLIEIRNKIVAVLKQGPFIDFEEHALMRIVEDSLMDEGDPKKRGWSSREEAKDCVLRMRKVLGVRLNVDHRHPKNTDKLKHLHQQFAIIIEGRKNEDDRGRLVLVILNEGQITIVTVL